MDFFESYISYLINIGYKITLYKNLTYGLEYKGKYTELSFEELSSLSRDASDHILLKLDNLIQTKGKDTPLK